jgi:hypothetical protein
MRVTKPLDLPPCPPPNGGVHSPWMIACANRLARTQVPPEEAETMILEAMTRPPSPANEVSATIRKVYNEPQDRRSPIPWKGMQAEKPVFCPSKLRKIAARMDGVDEEWLAIRSRVRVDNRTPASFLHAIFRQGENVLVFSKYRSQGQTLWIHPGFPFDAGALNEFCKGASDGVWFLSNPCDGQFRDIPRLVSEHNPTGRSRRAEESLTDYRHLLIESDEVDPSLWLSVLIQLPLPILSIVTSGKRSIHALIATDCHTSGQWEALVEGKWKPRLVRLGACQSSTSAVRLTRLPCCRRECEDSEQKLLFLNPNPDFTPICELPEFPAPIPLQNPHVWKMPPNPYV